MSSESKKTPLTTSYSERIAILDDSKLEQQFKQLTIKPKSKTIKDLPLNVLYEINKKLPLKERTAFSIAASKDMDIPSVFSYDRAIKNITMYGNQLFENGTQLIKELDLLVLSKPYVFKDDDLPTNRFERYKFQKLFSDDIKRMINGLIKDLERQEELFNKLNSITPTERGSYVIRNINIPIPSSRHNSEGPVTHGEEIRSAFSKAVRTFGSIAINEKDLQELIKKYQKSQEWRDRNNELHTITEKQARTNLIRMLKPKGVQFV